MKIKVCGITRADDARQCRALGADYLGLVFAASVRRLSLPAAIQIASALADFKGLVGVFANQPAGEVEETARRVGFRILQFHGGESPLYCTAFRKRGFEVMKAFHVQSQESLSGILSYDLDCILLDARGAERAQAQAGTFDWNLLKTWDAGGRKVFLSGGLSPDNIEALLKIYRPYGVDASSQLEKTPGVKDASRVERFIAAVRRSQHGEKLST